MEKAVSDFLGIVDKASQTATGILGAIKGTKTGKATAKAAAAGWPSWATPALIVVGLLAVVGLGFGVFKRGGN